MFHPVLLRNTARAYNLQCSYKSVEGTFVWSPDRTLIKMLEDLSGKKISCNEDLQSIFDQKIRNHYDSKINACFVFWDGAKSQIEIRTQNFLSENIDATLLINESDSKKILLKKILERKTNHGCKTRFVIEEKLPIGYHKLQLTIEQVSCVTLLICPPLKLKQNSKPTWGPFVPLYALKSESDWGMGSFKEAQLAADVLKPYGAKWMGLLPMLAGNFDYPDCDPSPYSSLSRLFWNEIYLDVEALVAKYRNEKAAALIKENDFLKSLADLRSQTHVDYYGVYHLKKKVLLLLSDAFFEKQLDQTDSYLCFKNENPDIDDYAAFRSNELREQNFHRFVQFEMNNTMKEFSQNQDFGLYMDYPVGVNDSGFDYKKFRSVFYGEVSVGAPPEPVFALGQDWGFPAFHPMGMQKDQYNYFRKTLRHHLKFCKILRLDHIMGLYRIYSVPKNFKGDEGVYLRFPPEELFAVVILEAHLAGADLIGENLGTVPAAVDRMITERNLNGMWVLECETWRSKNEAALAIRPNSLACLNTHDMPMMASFRKTKDLDLVASLNILSQSTKQKLQALRAAEVKNWEKDLSSDHFIENAVEMIAKSPAKYFVVNLEDLWQEESPQNIPGTWKEYPNWRKKFALPAEQWTQNKTAEKALRILKELRG